MLTKEEGREEGREEEKANFVKNLLLNTNFDIAKIAALSGASITVVEKIRKDIKLT
ncbi:hypothetical protein [Dyadobacter sp. NIV53]|uniref:hypothetical protein n=1 Tax=Dyadobacter sp. NIV53 TaxID=2861765 RepID=UPI001C88573F|nr:hypothetical protein [Dyadobacter sp. NIV53]